MKKVFKINASVCDARKVQEETLAAYDEIRINSAVMLVDPASQALLNKYPVSMNTSTVLEMEGDVKLAVINGKHTLEPGGALPEGKCYLLVNGKLDALPGCEELLKRYVGITVNGKVTCPKSLAGYFAAAQINGKLETYPDSCIRLKDEVVLDRTFLLRAKEGGRYYAAKRITALAGDIDFDALAARGVSFVTPELLVWESLCEKAVPLFDVETDITVLPDGCAYVDDDAVLDENLLRRYGDKLYIDGDLTVNAGSRAVLDKMVFLKVNGDLEVTRSMADAAAGLKAEYDELKITADTVISERESLTVDRELLENTDNLGIEECGTVTFDPDVPAGLIREKVENISECGTVICTKNQRAAVERLAEEVGDIREPGQEGRDDEGEDRDDEGEDKVVRKVNSATYIL